MHEAQYEKLKSSLQPGEELAAAERLEIEVRGDAVPCLCFQERPMHHHPTFGIYYHGQGSFQTLDWSQSREFLQDSGVQDIAKALYVPIVMRCDDASNSREFVRALRYAEGASDFMGNEANAANLADHIAEWHSTQFRPVRLEPRDMIFDWKPQEPAGEADYNRGYRAAWEAILRQALTHVDDASMRTRSELALERSQVVTLLRQVCERAGDNDWDESLYLPDVIENHLLPYLGRDEDEPT